MWPAVYVHVHTRSDIYSIFQWECSVIIAVILQNLPIVTWYSRYSDKLSSTLSLGITFTANSEDDLVGYTSSRLRRTCRRSEFYRAVIYRHAVSGGPVSHQSKLQSTVAFSSTQAEYMATTEAGKEALWLAWFLVCLSGFAYVVDLRNY